jgi:predicted alpha/beta superfamily hydrolase
MKETFPDQSLISSFATVKAVAGGALHLHEFPSRIFRNKRMLRVWVPEEYERDENSGRRYAVFYLNDGQNLFESATSFTGIEWQVGETAGRMIRAGLIPPMIFVGIDNARLERLKEYLPYRSVNPPVLRPRGAQYPDFLVKEVMPFVAQRYRVAKGPEHTALGGSSLGGLISLYVMLAAPGVFGYALLESPSLWVANRKILRECRGFRRWPEKVFMGVGTREVGRDDKDLQTVENVRELERILRRSGLEERRLRVEIADGATHSEGAWAARFPDALGFFFGGKSTQG